MMMMMILKEFGGVDIIHCNFVWQDSKNQSWFFIFLVVDFEQESNLEKQNLNTQLKIWMYKRLRLIVVLCWEEKDSS